MNARNLKILIFLTIIIEKCCGENIEKPNIVLILADDMGFNDVSFRGSNQFLTPNIDALGYNGMIINKYYVPALCTPSRATLLTGKFPIHTGTQHFVIPNDEPWGMPLNETTMPEIFRNAGYSTNLVGKWHLGFFKKSYTPTFRGFDYHYGYYGGYIGYWDHSLCMTDRKYGKGYDFRRNLDVNREGNGTYATDLFTNEAVRVIREHDEKKPLFLVVTHLAPHTGNEDDPLQAPNDEIDRLHHINEPNRRIYAAMVRKLDQSVGKIVKAISDKKILDNTIIVFYSDNGAPTVGLHANSGSNFPFKGQKHSPWEGGIRTPAVIFSPLLQNRNRIWQQTFYAADWLPTLAAAAGIKLNSNLILDGINLWTEMKNGDGLMNRRLVHNIDEIINYSSYQRGPWKYIKGTTSNGGYDTWLGLIGNEIDPESINYSETILNSQVSKVLRSNSFHLSSELVDNLRADSQIKCPESQNASLAYMYKCVAFYEACLFNIEEDPCEKYNLAHEYPSILSSMEADIEYFKKTAVKPARIAIRDKNSDPNLNGGLWTWWQDENNSSINHNLESGSINYKSAGLLLYSICLITILSITNCLMIV